MVRTFQPVGHGTFVTEQFKHGQNVIFDCGSETSLDLIKALIKTNFEYKEQIDCVFLSSLDREHAGGLEALLEWCHVAKIIIPNMEKDERAFTLLRYLCEGGTMDDFLAKLITDPKNALSIFQIQDRRLPIVTQVSEETDKEKNVFDIPMPMDLMPWKAVEGFRVCVDNKLDWVYRPNVYRQRVSLKQLAENLAAEGIDPRWMDSVEKLVRGWRQNPIRNGLIKAYEQLRRPISPVTMTVYSGPEYVDYRLYERLAEDGQWSYRGKVYAGALLTGELPLGVERVQAKLCMDMVEYQTHMGSVLVPGHGAAWMFHESILPKRNGVVVSTTDTENMLCLPHGKVVKVILEHELPYYVVTEVQGSLARFAVIEALN